MKARRNSGLFLFAGHFSAEDSGSEQQYAINNLGTCKHIEFTLAQLMKKRSAQKAFSSAYLPPIPRCT
jgi:hypothetical protein